MYKAKYTYKEWFYLRVFVTALMLLMIATICNTYALEGSRTEKLIGSGGESEGPSQWRLTGIPHGVTFERSDFSKEYTIHKLDSKGGDIEVRQWQKNSPACFQTARYRWTFGKDVSQIHQDDEIAVDVSVAIVDENVCGDVGHWNPYLRFYGANGEASGGSKYLGQVSPSAQYLTWGDSKRVYARKGAAYWKGVPIGSGSGTLRVTDRTGIGAEMNAPDGYFKISLSHGPGSYDVVYLYEADTGSGSPAVSALKGPGWRLTDTPHGVTFERSDFPKEYTIHKLDSKGGDIEVRQWQKRSPACFQTARYRWSFGKDVSQICLDDEIAVDVSVAIVDENVCGDVGHWNPYLRFYGANGGASGGSKYLGQVSPSAQYLTWGDSKRVYARKGAAHWKGVPIGSGSGTLSVTDRTGIGAEMNAPDGYFKISLSHGPGSYDVVYKYIADASGCGAQIDVPSGIGGASYPQADDLSGTWVVMIIDPYAWYKIRWEIIRIGEAKWRAEQTLLDTNHSFNRRLIGKRLHDYVISSAEHGKFILVGEGGDTNPGNPGYFKQTAEGTYTSSELSAQGTHKGSRIEHWMKIKGTRE